MYEQMGYLVHRRCLSILGNASDASDALQDTFVRAMKYPPKELQSKLGWLYGIATRVCFDALERRKRTQAWPARVLTQVKELLGDAPTPQPELKLTMASELAKLDATTREMVVLHHIDGLTQEEIAEQMGYSRKWVGIKLKNGEERLRGLLGEAEPGATPGTTPGTRKDEQP
jgi:RNA polymerase sigma factor (sigma-70 family)